MKYVPRKVFILENASYAELTYEEFRRRKEADESYQNKLFIPVQGCLLETDREHYKAFYKEKELMLISKGSTRKTVCSPLIPLTVRMTMVRILFLPIQRI